MMTMKRDMTGAGVVLAVMAALRRRRLPGAGHRPAAAAPRTPSAADSIRPGDVLTPLRRPHHRGHQHRRRGPAGARRRAGLRRRRARARRARRHRHPDRRDEGRARASAPAASSPPTTRWPPRSRGRVAGGRRAAVADAAGRRTTRSGSPPRSPTPTTPGRRPGRDHRRAVPAALHRRPAVGAPRHRVGRRLADRRASSRPRAPPASAPARCCTGWSCASRWPASSLPPTTARKETPMHGLTVRWSLARRPGRRRGGARVVRRARPRTPASPAWKGCASRPGGCAPASGSRAATSSSPRQARDAFQEEFSRHGRRVARVREIVGSAPVLIEPCDVVAVAEGGAGFLRRPVPTR